jgi:hypothetical protein
MDELEIYRDTLIYLVLLMVVFLATVVPALLAIRRMRARSRHMRKAGGRMGYEPWSGKESLLLRDLEQLGVVEASSTAAVFHPLYREEARRRSWLFDLLAGQSGWRRYLLRDRAAGSTRTVVLVHSDAMDSPYLMVEPENPRTRALGALADRIETLHGLEPLELPMGVRPVPGIRIRTRTGRQAQALRVVMESGLLETLRREKDVAVRAHGSTMAVIRPLSPTDPRQVGALLTTAETLVSELEGAAPPRAPAEAGV